MRARSIVSPAAWKRLITRNVAKMRRLSAPVSAPIPAPAPEPQPYDGPRVDFQCNVCGYGNTRVPLDLVRNREESSCLSCGSSLRMRSIVYLLSMELFGEALVLPRFPEDRSIVGLGLSDWDGYAIGLAEKLGYTN